MHLKKMIRYFSLEIITACFIFALITCVANEIFIPDIDQQFYHSYQMKTENYANGCFFRSFVCEAESYKQFFSQPCIHKNLMLYVAYCCKHIPLLIRSQYRYCITVNLEMSVN